MLTESETARYCKLVRLEPNVVTYCFQELNFFWISRSTALGTTCYVKCRLKNIKLFSNYTTIITQ